MNQRPTVSVIIPCYNAELFVREAIDSVLNQSYANIEIIVVDDGSTDASRDVVNTYGSRVRYQFQQNAGAPAARNAGIRSARGEFLQFLDADDRILPAKIEKQLECFTEDSSLGVVYGPYYKMDTTGKHFDLVEGGAGSGDIFHNLLSWQYFIATHSCLIRTEAVRNVGYFDTSLKSTEDWDLWIRLAVKSRFKYLDMPLAEYRDVASSSSKNLDTVFETSLTVMEKNSHHHSECAACRRAVRLATSRIHRFYGVNQLRLSNLPAARKHFMIALKASPSAFCNRQTVLDSLSILKRSLLHRRSSG